MKQTQKDQSPKKELVLDPAELKRVTDFFTILIQVDQREKKAKKGKTV